MQALSARNLAFAGDRHHAGDAIPSDSPVQAADSWPAVRAMTRRFQVCSSGADGLCAVRQWRLQHPQPATLITGLQRDTALLQQVPAEAGDEVLVCDLAVHHHRGALQRLRDAGVRVHHIDHHGAGGWPRHAGLQGHPIGAPPGSTSLVMDQLLGGRFLDWALVGAYGDGLTAVAHQRAAAAGHGQGQREALRRLGEAIQYNGRGDPVRDACIPPAALLQRMGRHASPLDMADAEPVIDTIHLQRLEDLQHALAMGPVLQTGHARAVLLPDVGWSRRVIGTLAQALAAAAPGQAHAVLRQRADGGYVVSVRAPRKAPGGADVLCAAFGGGGRPGEAGIDSLPAAWFERFLAAFGAFHWRSWAAIDVVPMGPRSAHAARQHEEWT